MFPMLSWYDVERRLARDDRRDQSMATCERITAPLASSVHKR